jgi:hypothetical protein
MFEAESAHAIAYSYSWDILVASENSVADQITELSLTNCNKAAGISGLA